MYKAIKGKALYKVLFTVLLVMLSAVVQSACTADSNNSYYKTILSREGSLDIVRHLPVQDFNHGRLAYLPSYDENNTDDFQVDLRGYDLTGLDVTGRHKDLLFADFDTGTKWPAKLPQGFNTEKLMELGKNPGLNVRELHKRGINGNGIGLAIIDMGLLADHIEYKDRLKMYEELHCADVTATMHGTAVASIAVGENVGVAPRADLYYIAETHENMLGADFSWTAKSIDRLLQVNKMLPKEKKVRVISISAGWSPNYAGYEEVAESVERAKKEGVFVISTALRSSYKLDFHGLGRSPLDDPDNYISYNPGLRWGNNFFSGKFNPAAMGFLLVPMDSRCTAGPAGNSDYAFYPVAGLSWSVPYIAGLYALACQVYPNITPDLFWSEALKTGDIREIAKSGEKYRLGKIVNPVRLMESLQKMK